MYITELSKRIHPLPKRQQSKQVLHPLFLRLAPSSGRAPGCKCRRSCGRVHSSIRNHQSMTSLNPVLGKATGRLLQPLSLYLALTIPHPQRRLASMRGHVERKTNANSLLKPNFYNVLLAFSQPVTLFSDSHCSFRVASNYLLRRL